MVIQLEKKRENRKKARKAFGEVADRSDKLTIQ